MREKLKIGILINSHQIYNWEYSMLNEIQNSNFASIELVIQWNHSLQNNSQLRHSAKHHRTILQTMVKKIDDFLFHPQPNAFELKNIEELFPDLSTINVQGIEDGSKRSMQLEDLKKIREHQLDVIVFLGNQNLSKEVLNLAQHGIWSFYQSDDDLNLGEQGFWEVYNKNRDTESCLQIISDDPQDCKILCRSFSQTDHISGNRNQSEVYWKSLAFLPRKLKELHESGQEVFLKRSDLENRNLHFNASRNSVIKNDWILLGNFFRLYIKKFVQKIENLFSFDQWILRYSYSQDNLCETNMPQFIDLLPPKDRFWADPFVVYENDNYYLFLEECFYSTGKGHLSCMTIDKKGNYSEPQIILKKPYHLSYPFIFTHEGQYYMIPETGQNRTIDLYRCIDFPHQWEFVKNLMEDVSAYDTTLHYQDGKWWMFANIKEHPGASSCDELFLFHADDFLSECWTSHPQNPIVSDVNSARPAGKLFWHDGNLYRPSQNCSKRYGYGTKINQIITLNETDYKEVCVSEIESLWEKKIKAVHTLNHDHDLTLSDAILRRSKFY